MKISTKGRYALRMLLDLAANQGDGYVALKDIAERVRNAVVVCKVKAGEKGKIFGSVTSLEICNALNNSGFEVEKKMIILPEPIKTLGVYTVEIRFMAGVSSKVSVKVQAAE